MKDPKQKSKELIDKFISEGCLFANAKKCAIVCVNEILKVIHSDKRASSSFDKEYWEKVKIELQKL